ncbi:MAG: hypothetical protein M1608_12250 [Candidatus Omnitrophica bacterium]|nr:hypothetical protein [Candidatus Omnitrophota bacterium]
MPKQIREKVGNVLRISSVAWGFAHTGTRAGKILQPATGATLSPSPSKWGGTHHDHFFRLSVNGH